MEDSIFTKIIRGELPAHKVYEDDKTFAFLDIHPAAEAHTLVIPKKQVEFIWDLEEDDYQALMATVRKVGLRLREVIGKPYVGEMVVGVDVPHTHVHLIPFAHTDEMKRSLEGKSIPPSDDATLAAVASKLRFS